MMNIYCIVTIAISHVIWGGFFNIASILHGGIHSLTQEINICGSQHLKMGFLVVTNPFSSPLASSAFWTDSFPSPQNFSLCSSLPLLSELHCHILFPVNFWTCGDALLRTSCPLCLVDITTLFLLPCPDRHTTSTPTTGQITFHLQRTFFILVGSFLADGK